MRKLIVGLILIINFGMVNSQPDLKVYGSLRKIMHENDTSEKVRLNLLGPLFNYYGLGAVAGLDGEILILDGDTYVTGVWNGSLATDKSTDVGAALLVTTIVQSWDTLSIGEDLSSLKQLEGYLENLVFKDQAFPFMVLSSEGMVRWHVISRPRNAEAMKDHKNLGLKGIYEGEYLILGIFSTSHEGVFTHQGQSTHMHFQSADKLYAGHVDELIINHGDKLLIPNNLQR